VTADPRPVAWPPGLPVHSVHHLENVMGTVVTIDVYTTDGRAGAELSRELATARALLQRADAVFSTWKPDSPVSRLRRGEITSAQAPAEVSEVLEQCAIARELSGGWFDPWAMPGGIDPTGYVKGWAAQRALGAFRASSIYGAIVNAAGDIASVGGQGISRSPRARPVAEQLPAPRGRGALGDLYHFTVGCFWRPRERLPCAASARTARRPRPPVRTERQPTGTGLPAAARARAQQGRRHRR